MALRIAFLSDLHISRYGDTNEPPTMKDVLPIKAGGRVVDKGIFWSTECTQGGWKIQTHDYSLEHWRVLDPDGNRRPTRVKGLNGLKRQVKVWQQADARLLTVTPPSADKRASLLLADPDNTNLRLLEIRDALDGLNPPADWLVISGDLTDNGYGYYYLRQVLKPWFDRDRVFLVPGNHDLNRILPPWFKLEPGTTTRDDKTDHFWRWYEDELKRSPFRGGCSDPVLSEQHEVAFIGLDSVKNNARSGCAMNAVGKVSSHAINRLKNVVHEVREQIPDCFIIVVLHHHILWRGLAPSESFLWLQNIENASEVMDVLKDLRIDVVASGHRHSSYNRDDLSPMFPHLLSSPSSTLGDKRRKDLGRFFWVMDVQAGEYKVTSQQIS